MFLFRPTSRSVRPQNWLVSLRGRAFLEIRRRPRSSLAHTLSGDGASPSGQRRQATYPTHSDLTALPGTARGCFCCCPVASTWTSSRRTTASSWSGTWTRRREGVPRLCKKTSAIESTWERRIRLCSGRARGHVALHGASGLPATQGAGLRCKARLATLDAHLRHGQDVPGRDWRCDALSAPSQLSLLLLRIESPAVLLPGAPAEICCLARTRRKLPLWVVSALRTEGTWHGVVVANPELLMLMISHDAGCQRGGGMMPSRAGIRACSGDRSCGSVGDSCLDNVSCVYGSFFQPRRLLCTVRLPPVELQSFCTACASLVRAAVH